MYVPGGKLGSLFLTEEYFSPVPFEVPFYEGPVPSSVTYSVPGTRGGFPNCLHEKIDIPNLEAGVVTRVAGNIAGIGGQINGQIFEETNITEWQYQVVSHTQQFKFGYHAIKIGVLPPDEPAVTIE